MCKLSGKVSGSVISIDGDLLPSCGVKTNCMMLPFKTIFNKCHIFDNFAFFLNILSHKIIRVAAVTVLVNTLSLMTSYKFIVL